MKGKMIITAAPMKEDLARQYPGASGVQIEIHLDHVSRQDRVCIVQSVMEALDFEPEDYGLLAILLMDHKGENHRSTSVRMPLG